MPIQCEYFAMEGLAQMIEVIRQVIGRSNSRLEFGGILLTMYDAALGADRRGRSRGAGLLRGDRLFNRDSTGCGRGRGAEPWTLGDRLRPAIAGGPRLRGTVPGGAGACLRNVDWVAGWKRCWVAAFGERAKFVRERRRRRRRRATAATSSDVPPARGEQRRSTDGDVTRSSDGQQWLPLAAIDRNPYQPRHDVRRSRDRRPVRQHSHARLSAADRRAAARRRLSTHRRRAPAAGRADGGLGTRAGADSRRRRSADGRAGDRRERPAQGPQPDRKGGVVPALHGRVPVHAGRPGGAGEHRPLDDRQPGAAAGAARRSEADGRRAASSPPATPGRCCRWATSTSRSSSPGGFTRTRCRSARPSRR